MYWKRQTVDRSKIIRSLSKKISSPGTCRGHASLEFYDRTVLGPGSVLGELGLREEPYREARCQKHLKLNNKKIFSLLRTNVMVIFSAMHPTITAYVVMVGGSNLQAFPSKLCDCTNDRSFSARNKPLQRPITRPIEICG